MRAISLFRILRNLKSSRTGATATREITLLHDAEFHILLWEFRYPPILGLYEKAQSVPPTPGRRLKRQE